MIRRTVYALILSLLLLFLCLWPRYDLEQNSRTAEELLSQALEAVERENLPEAASSIMKAQKLWEAWQSRATCYLRHSELDPVQEAMEEVAARLDTGESGELLVACRRARLLVRHLAQTERPTWGNLF